MTDLVAPEPDEQPGPWANDVEEVSSGAGTMRVRMEAIHRELMAATDDFTRVRIRDEARAAAEAAAILGYREIQVYATVLVQDAEREIVKANPPLLPTQRGRGNKIVIRDNDFTDGDLRQMRSAHKRTDEQHERLREEAIKTNTPLTRKALMRPNPFERNADNPRYEWWTPEPILEAAMAAMGGIDLDPASCAEANEAVGAREWWGAADRSLDRDWHGRVWCNPPYGKPFGGAFIEKFVAECESGRLRAGCLLVLATRSHPIERVLATAPNICWVNREGKWRGPDATSAPARISWLIVALYGHQRLDPWNEIGVMR